MSGVLPVHDSEEIF